MTTETIVSHFRAIERAQTIHRIERRPVNAERIWEAAAWLLFLTVAVLALMVF